MRSCADGPGSRLRLPLLYVISSADAVGNKPLEDVLVAVAEAQPSMLQIREDCLTDRELVHLARRLSRCSQTPILMNDRCDLARASGCAGVHLKSAGIPTRRARDLLGPAALVGRSTHHPGEVIREAQEGVDFLVFGPVFETPAKRKFGPPQGVEQLRRACEAAPGTPIVAIGGIDRHNAAACMEAGAAGVAVVREVLAADDPGRAVGELKKAIRFSPDKEPRE